MPPIHWRPVIFFLAALPVTAQPAPGPRGPDRAPAVGAPIPAVSAQRLGADQRVDLSKPERLTVLIFGSHT